MERPLHDSLDRPVTAPARACSARFVPLPRTWDGRLARWLVTPLVGTAVTPNQLTTLRLILGVAGALALAAGSYAWVNAGALLIVLSNFVDHTDGELARISGRSSRIGHYYDLACDALVTVLLFAGMGLGVANSGAELRYAGSPAVLGAIAGLSVALIFFLRMRIEDRLGKTVVAQGFLAGFETEDVLYLLPLVTLFDVAEGFVLVAAIGASLFALWVVFDYLRVMRRPEPAS
jgi:archaetidylinositol phosphate synthase